MTAKEKSIDERIERLHAYGIVDLHFDMLMDLYEKRDRTSVLATDYLPELEAGGIGVLGAAIYIEDRYCRKWRCALRSIRLPGFMRRRSNARALPFAKAIRRSFGWVRLGRLRCSSPWKESSRSAPTWTYCVYFTNSACASLALRT